MAVAASTPPLISYTTVTWTTETRPGAASDFLSTHAYIEYSGSVYFGLSSGATNNTILKRTSAGVWSTITLPSPTTSQGVRSLAANLDNSLWVAMGNLGSCSWYSTNQGSTWSVSNFTSIIPSGGSMSNGFCCVNGVFLLTSNNSSGNTTVAYTSTNGQTWTNNGTITGNQAGNYGDPVKLVTNGTKTAAVGTSGNWSIYYYYVNSGSTLIQGTATNNIAVGNSGPAGTTWSPDLGWTIISGYAGTTIKYFSSATALTGAAVPVSDTGMALGGVQAVSRTGYNTVLLCSPWNASTTWRINYSLGNGGSWVNTTLPAGATSGYFLASQGNNTFVTPLFNSNSVYIGTLS